MLKTQIVYCLNLDTPIEDMRAAGLWEGSARMRWLRQEILFDFLTLYGIDKWKPADGTIREDSEEWMRLVNVGGREWSIVQLDDPR